MTNSQSAAERPLPLTGGHNPYLVAYIVSLAPFMEILDTSIANVSLQHIAGSLAASLDESTWVLTSYLVANAVILPASSWLASTFGRKRFYLACVVVFTISSFLCGIAWSLPSLIFFRILQGLGGGGMAPSGQAILADLFPPEKRGTAFTIFGLAVVVAPAIGPTLGGWITDEYSWHWIFFINVPVGIVSVLLVFMLVGEARNPGERPTFVEAFRTFDAPGFALFALFLGSLEVVLDRGQREDWLGSNFIVTFAAISAGAFVLFVPWVLLRRRPIVDLRIFTERQFAASFVMMLVTGGVLIGTTQFIPELFQSNFGYTATLAGLILSPGGFVAMLMMPIVNIAMRLTSPKWAIAFGLLVVGSAMYHLTGLNGDITFGYAVLGRIYQAVGLPFAFIGLTTACYIGLPGNQTDLASSMINVARNLGGSIGVSISQTILAQREQFHQSRLVENIIPSGTAYQQVSSTVRDYFLAQGSSLSDAAGQVVQWMGQQVSQQATLLAYIDIFWVMCLAALFAAPLTFALRK